MEDKNPSKRAEIDPDRESLNHTKPPIPLDQIDQAK
jgi:hypothetical protein